MQILCCLFHAQGLLKMHVTYVILSLELIFFEFYYNYNTCNFLARSDTTMILQTGQEINEMDQSGFYTQGPTVFTGNMGGGKYIVQVNQSLSLTSALYKEQLTRIFTICDLHWRVYLNLTSFS